LGFRGAEPGTIRGEGAAGAATGGSGFAGAADLPTAPPALAAFSAPKSSANWLGFEDLAFFMLKPDHPWLRFRNT